MSVHPVRLTITVEGTFRDDFGHIGPYLGSAAKETTLELVPGSGLIQTHDFGIDVDKLLDRAITNIEDIFYAQTGCALDPVEIPRRVYA